MDSQWQHHTPATGSSHSPTLPTGASTNISLTGILPEAGMGIMQNILASATQSLWIEMYMFDSDLVAKMLLQQKTTYPNLDLRLLYHQPNLPPSLDPTHSQDFPAWASPNKGIRTNGQPIAIHHAKFILVDADVPSLAKAYIMTANFTAQALGGNKAGYANREYILCDTDPADIALLKALFLADAAGLALPTVPPSSNLIISDMNALALVPLLMQSAKHSLAIQVEYLNDPPGSGMLNLNQILLHAAQNGVAVQVMLPPLSPTAPGVPSADNNATYQILSPTIAVNVTPQYFMHAKMIIVDEQLAFVGSQNLSHQSLHFSREVGILISDQKVVSHLLATFAADWLAAQNQTH